MPPAGIDGILIRLALPSISATVLDAETGRPVDGATVRLTENGTEQTSDPSGRVTFSELPSAVTSGRSWPRRRIIRKGVPPSQSCPAVALTWQLFPWSRSTTSMLICDWSGPPVPRT